MSMASRTFLVRVISHRSADNVYVKVYNSPAKTLCRDRLFPGPMANVTEGLRRSCDTWEK
jgi:hypothetical protein